MSAISSPDDHHEQLQSLSEVFDEVLELVDRIGSSRTDADDFQDEIKKAIHILETCTRRANELQLLYWAHEDDREMEIEDVAIANLKYLLLPALLGYLTLKLADTERADVVRLGRIYYRDYLKRLNSLGLPDDSVDAGGGGVFATIEDDVPGSNGQPSPMEGCSPPPPDSTFNHEQEVSSTNRTERELTRTERRILRCKYLKRIELDLASMAQTIANPNSTPIDDDFIRNYHLSRLKRWVAFIHNDMEHLDREMVQLQATGHFHEGQWHDWSDRMTVTNPYDDSIYPILPYVDLDDNPFPAPSAEQDDLMLTTPLPIER